jgi:hypothetical protein
MTNPCVHIPGEVLFQNPSILGFDIETIRTCMLINKDWLKCIQSFKKQSIESSFSKFREMTKLSITDDNNAFRLNELHRFLTIIQNHIICPDMNNIKLLMNRELFQKNITEDSVDVTLKCLLNIQTYMWLEDNYEINKTDWRHVIIRILVIGYTFQFIDKIFLLNLQRYTDNTHLKQAILERGRFLSQQIKEVTYYQPNYKTLCNNVQRILRHTCRSIK